jgi:hypothetical protein
MDRPTQLRQWIEDTRRLQRKLAVACTAAFAIALAIRLWNAPIGGVALLLVALVTTCAFWVTASHNAAHRQKLQELAVARVGATPRRG